jgi:hypothetical protein
MGMNDFRLAVVGGYYDNPDGSSRQAELAICQPGEPARMVREHDNEHDPRAVAVFSARGVQVGYLPRDRAAWLCGKFDRGYDIRAIVDRIKGEADPHAPLNMVLRVNMEGDDPDLGARVVEFESDGWRYQGL